MRIEMFEHFVRHLIGTNTKLIKKVDKQWSLEISQTCLWVALSASECLWLGAEPSRDAIETVITANTIFGKQLSIKFVVILVKNFHLYCDRSGE